MYMFAIKEDLLILKNCILFEKNSKKIMTQKMTREHFQKMAVSPKPLSIFEFCKKHFIRNCFGILPTKFQFRKLKTDFLNKYFQFSIRSRSFQGQGHF